MPEGESQYLHSGEPIPIPPEGDDADLNAYLRKLTDYLRRLTAKLSSNIYAPPPAASTGSLATLALTLDGDLSKGNDMETVVWDQVLRQDSAYTYSTGVVTFVTAGLYLILAEINVLNGMTEYTTQFIDGDAFVLPYGKGNLNIVSTGVWVQNTQHVVVHMHAAQTIAFQADTDGASIESDYSRMTVIRLGDFTGSGDVSDPCDLDIWQLCA